MIKHGLWNLGTMTDYSVVRSHGCGFCQRNSLLGPDTVAGPENQACESCPVGPVGMLLHTSRPGHTAQCYAQSHCLESIKSQECFPPEFGLPEEPFREFLSWSIVIYTGWSLGYVWWLHWVRRLTRKDSVLS